MKQRYIPSHMLGLFIWFCIIVSFIGCTMQSTSTPPTPVLHTTPDTATAIGRIILGYGDYSPVPNLPLWLGKESIGEPVTHTNANGEFILSGLPVGQVINVVDDHLFFQINVTSSGIINLGTIEYPLMHP